MRISDWSSDVCSSDLSYLSVSKKMRSDDTLAMKSSWLPLTGPEDGGAVYSGCWVCAGGGGSSSGAFLAQAARAMIDVAMIRCREIFFIFFLLERWFRPPFCRDHVYAVRYAVKTI